MTDQKKTTGRPEKWRETPQSAKTGEPSNSTTITTSFDYMKAEEYLKEAMATLTERGKQYDAKGGERSIGAAVAYAALKAEALAKKDRPRLFLIRGVPGSGKTTYAKTLGIKNHYEADMWFDAHGGYDPAMLKQAHGWCQKMAVEAMEKGEDVVVSNTFTRLWEMEPYKKAANRLGVEIIEKVMMGNWNNVHGVPKEKVDEMRERFEYSDGEN